MKEENIVTISEEFPDKPFNENPEKHTLSNIFTIVNLVVLSFFFFELKIGPTIVFFLAFIIHDLGHLLAMKYFKYYNNEMFNISFWGKLLNGTNQLISQKEKAIILLAGPLPGVGIGLILFYFGLKNEDSYILLLSKIFLFLNLFYLLPLSNFDGGKFLETIFKRSKYILRILFVILLFIGLIVFSIYINSYLMMFISTLALLEIRKPIKYIKSIRTLEKLHLNYNKPFEMLTNQEYWLIRKNISSYFVDFYGIDTSKYVVSSGENNIVSIIKSFADDSTDEKISLSLKVILVSVWATFVIIAATVLQSIFYL